jgi:hypothetical protein
MVNNEQNSFIEINRCAGQFKKKIKTKIRAILYFIKKINTIV